MDPTEEDRLNGMIEEYERLAERDEERAAWALFTDEFKQEIRERRSKLRLRDFATDRDWFNAVVGQPQPERSLRQEDYADTESWKTAVNSRSWGNDIAPPCHPDHGPAKRPARPRVALMLLYLWLFCLGGALTGFLNAVTLTVVHVEFNWFMFAGLTALCVLASFGCLHLGRTVSGSERWPQ